MQRYVMHLDMDAFFASIEQLDHPEWRGKPLIVGGQIRGVVSTASYEARKFGVHSAMPIHEAKKRCPHAIYIPPNMRRYQDLSQKIHHCLENFSPLVEMASIDEAYLDATGLENLFGTPEELGKKIKAAIYEVTGGLKCSIGIAPIKFLAKICSEERKPDGLFILEEKNMPNFLHNLELGRIPGVGKKFLEALHEIGVKRGSDVLRLPPEFWEQRYGKGGKALFERVSGIDPREVVPYREPKSESAETTLEINTLNKKELKTWLLRHAERVGSSLRRHNLAGRTITLKVKFADFQQITRQMSLPTRTNCTDTIFQCACSLLDELTLTQSVRLIGLGVSAFQPEPPTQFSLITPSHLPDEKKRQNLDTTIDSLRLKYGSSAVIRGRLFEKNKKE